MGDRYQIYVGRNKEIAEAVQKELYDGGGWWNREGPDRHKILTNPTNYICLRKSTMEVSYSSGYPADFGEELTLHDLFRDREKWSKPPVKEMTVEAISKELGYDVKIVK